MVRCKEEEEKKSSAAKKKYKKNGYLCPESWFKKTPAQFMHNLEGN